MRRRELLTFAAGAALRPAVGLAQSATMPVVGVLVLGTPDPGEFLAGLCDGLRQLGYVEGQNIRLDIRSAEGKAERLPGLAADLVREKVDVIVGYITPATLAAKKATHDIPIVMAGVGAPVETGIVASLARPGGNVTGTSATTAEIAQKNLQFLREAVPSLRRVGIVVNTADPVFGKVFLEATQNAAAQLQIESRSIPANGPGDVNTAFAAALREQVDAVVIQPSLGFKQTTALALANRLPAASPGDGFASAGGLLAYGRNGADMWRKVAGFVDKILKGAKPADLPVEEPTKFDLVINLKTAKALGLIVPQALLARAEEIIE